MTNDNHHHCPAPPRGPPPPRCCPSPFSAVTRGEPLHLIWPVLRPGSRQYRSDEK